MTKGFEVGSYSGVIEISKSSVEEISEVLDQLSLDPLPSAEQLAALVPEKRLEKFDEYLPDDLLCLGYGAYAFDMDKTAMYLKTNNRMFNKNND